MIIRYYQITCLFISSIFVQAQGLYPVQSSPGASASASFKYCIVVEDDSDEVIPQVMRVSPDGDTIFGPAYDYLWIFENHQSVRTNNPIYTSSSQVDRVYSVRIYNGPPPPAAVSFPQSPGISETEYEELVSPLVLTTADEVFIQDSNELLNLHYFHEHTCKDDKFQLIGIQVGGNVKSNSFVTIDYNSLISSPDDEVQRMNLVYETVIGLPAQSVQGMESGSSPTFNNKLRIRLGDLTQSRIFYIVFRTNEMADLAIPDTAYYSHSMNYKLTEKKPQGNDVLLWNSLEEIEIVAAHDPNILSMKVCEFSKGNGVHNVEGNIEFTNDGSKVFRGKISVKMIFPSEYNADSIKFLQTHVPGMKLTQTELIENGFVLQFDTLPGQGFEPFVPMGLRARIKWEMITASINNPCTLPEVYATTSFGNNFHWNTNTTAPQVMEYCGNVDDGICSDAVNEYSGFGIFTYWWRKWFNCAPCE